MASSTAATPALSPNAFAAVLYLVRGSRKRYSAIASVHKHNVEFEATKHAKRLAQHKGLWVDITAARNCPHQAVAAIPLPLLDTAPSPVPTPKSVGSVYSVFSTTDVPLATGDCELSYFSDDTSLGSCSTAGSSRSGESSVASIIASLQAHIENTAVPVPTSLPRVTIKIPARLTIPALDPPTTPQAPRLSVKPLPSASPCPHISLGPVQVSDVISPITLLPGFRSLASAASTYSGGNSSSEDSDECRTPESAQHLPIRFKYSPKRKLSSLVEDAYHAVSRVHSSAAQAPAAKRMTLRSHVKKPAPIMILNAMAA